MRGVHLFHLLGGNMRVEFAKMQLHGNARRFLGKVADPAGVVADGCVRMKPRGAEPGQQPAKAITNHSRLLPAFLADKRESRIDVDERLIEIDLLHQRDPFLHVRPFISQVDTFLNPVEERRHHREEPVFCIAIGNGTNVPVHAEDLLHHHQPRNRGSSRPGYVQIQCMAIRRFYDFCFAHLLFTSTV